MTARAGLAVLVDGVPLEADEARALWERFSEWMEEHRGDLAGFAAREGFASVHPGVDAGRPVLLASRTSPQRPYGPAEAARAAGPAPRSGGSPARHGAGPKPGSGRKKARK